MKKFLAIVFGLFVFLNIFSCKVLAENIKFIQVTDTHLSKTSKYSQNVLKSIVKDINKQENISFVVFTGDNIDSPSLENLETFTKIIKNLKYPYYIVIGNHDVYKNQGLSKKVYYEVIRKHNFFYSQRTPNYKFEKNGFVFFIIDGAKEVIPGPAGYYRENTLAWLDKELTKNKDKKAIILQHFPVEYPEVTGARYVSHQTYKVEEYRTMLAKHDNVLAILSGHFHKNTEKMVDGVYHISSPALMNIPHPYKIIDIVTTKEFPPIIYTQLKEVEVVEE